MTYHGSTLASVLAFWVLLWPVPHFAAHDITVRLIDNGSGRGVPHARVWLFLGDPSPRGAPHLEGRTREDGTVVFEVEHVPELLFVDGEVGGALKIGNLKSCSPPLFPATQVVQNGVVADNKCNRKGKWKGTFTANPGEIILFVRKQRFQN